MWQNHVLSHRRLSMKNMTSLTRWTSFHTNTSFPRWDEHLEKKDLPFVADLGLVIVLDRMSSGYPLTRFYTRAADALGPTFSRIFVIFPPRNPKCTHAVWQILWRPPPKVTKCIYDVISIEPFVRSTCRSHWLYKAIGVYTHPVAQLPLLRQSISRHYQSTDTYVPPFC